ncbi:unnamed protein product [Spirodela intermedia]|uniref:Strictosidine synthase conserved region domain-containing protein n=1 Tax=Spirodela intermedia TaxID=51605 RepID=A0A7I8JQW0_SPIIN|nr:unnamed protein product [Spirodela intermedia]CAA6672530.1 unnamed protein product [Spirodela intermedia]
MLVVLGIWGLQENPLNISERARKPRFRRRRRRPYTGVSNGQVLRWEERSRRWVEYAVPTRDRNRTQCDGSAVPAVEDVCGRPLGIQFHRETGKLYVADAYFGLLAVEPGGSTFQVKNGVDVDQETGVVYFTDSSTRFQRRSACGGLLQSNANMYIFVSSGSSGTGCSPSRRGIATGRFMRYDPATKQTVVLLRGLQFPNGVAVSSGGDFVLVAETTKQRVLRFWRTGRGVLGGRDVAGEECGGSEARRAGRTTQVLRRRSPSGTVSEVQEINGTLWLGSVESSFVAVYSRPSSSPLRLSLPPRLPLLCLPPVFLVLSRFLFFIFFSGFLKRVRSAPTSL